jgi:hypothetical protein
MSSNVEKMSEMYAERILLVWNTHLAEFKMQKRRLVSNLAVKCSLPVIIQLSILYLIDNILV